MKTLTKIITLFIFLFGFLILFDKIFNIKDNLIIHAVIIILSIFMMSLAYIIRLDNNINIFPLLDESMFKSDTDITTFLDEYFAITIRDFLPLFFAGVYLIAGDLDVVIIDIIILIIILSIHLYNLRKLASKYTK